MRFMILEFPRETGLVRIAGVLFGKVTIIGLGLLGGSIALGLRRFGLAGEVAGYVRDQDGVKSCERFGLADYATVDLLAAVSRADLVILATPVLSMAGLAGKMAPALKPGALVTDVGSVKKPVLSKVGPIVQSSGGFFVGSHPMAGSEKTGPSAARSDLLSGAVCVVTPSYRTPRRVLNAVRGLWEGLGCRVVEMEAGRHDAVVARTSHLPHVAASALAGLVLGRERRNSHERGRLCATGFRDTTRVASGSPELWRDILLANNAEVDRALGEYVAELERFRKLVRAANGAKLEKQLLLARNQRDAWLEDTRLALDAARLGKKRRRAALVQGTVQMPGSVRRGRAKGAAGSPKP